jgi:hypothetical protein
MILAISHPADLHATEVMRHLVAAGADATLLDTGQIPVATQVAFEHAHTAAWRGSARIDGGEVDLKRVAAVWWRRPLPFALHPALRDDADRQFAYAETHAAMTGIWSCLDARWMNEPDRDDRASRKAWQLKLASRLGLRVPRTCITNDPARAREFIASEGTRPVIYKAFTGTERTWRETRVLRPGEQDLFDAVRFAPVIFQEHIPAIVDLRVTIVGTRIFAAAITSQSTSYPHDFRMAMQEATVSPHEIPDDTAQTLLDLMNELGLVYGALDLRLTPDGEYVFLEINPAGQWLFVEQHTQQPISESIAAQLMTWDQG